MSTTQTAPVILALEWATAYGMEITESRMPSEAELATWADWYKPRAIYGVSGGRKIKLEHFGWRDLETVFGERKSTHSFPGCDNRAWILTPEELATILEIERSRADAQAAEQAAIANVAADQKRSIIEMAKNTGADQVLATWMADCDGTAVECSFDSLCQMVRPDGSTYIARTHCH